MTEPEDERPASPGESPPDADAQLDDPATAPEDDVTPNDEVDDDELDEEEGAASSVAARAAVGAVGARSTRTRVGRTASEALPTPSDAAVHVDDRLSALFVLGITGAFVLVLLYGMFLGAGGFLTAKPSPSPSPSPVASESASPGASQSTSPGTSESPAASTGPSGSAEASPSSSAGTSVSPAP